MIINLKNCAGFFFRTTSNFDDEAEDQVINQDYSNDSNAKNEAENLEHHTAEVTQNTSFLVLQCKFTVFI